MRFKKLTVVMVVFLLSGCEAITNMLCENKELLRISSPDAKVDAVLMRGDCGATTPYSYGVYIIPKGEKIKKSYLIFSADHVEGESVQWIAPKLLEIKYRQARIFEFTNFWQSRDVDNFNYVVEIREIPLTAPPSLSPR